MHKCQRKQCQVWICQTGRRTSNCTQCSALAVRTLVWTLFKTDLKHTLLPTVIPSRFSSFLGLPWYIRLGVHATGLPRHASSRPGWAGFCIGGKPWGNRFIRAPQDVSLANRKESTCAATAQTATRQVVHCYGTLFTALEKSA